MCGIQCLWNSHSLPLSSSFPSSCTRWRTGKWPCLLGDPTAKNAGRLTLNPVPHLDLIGSILLPVLMYATTGFMFGWAKPVPINPLNFRDRRWGGLKVAIAGPLSNLAIALAFGLAIRFLPVLQASPAMGQLVSFVVIINIVLALFNLIPVPPLDGSHILFSFLPRSWEGIRIALSQYGFVILLAFLFLFSGSRLLGYAVFSLFSFITGAR